MRNPVTETTFDQKVLLAVGPAPVDPRRELARRVSGGIEVTLSWNARDNSTSVEIRQCGSAETLLFSVDPERALEAFYHPFARLPVAFENLIPPPDA